MSFSGVYGPPSGGANSDLDEQQQKYVKMVWTRPRCVVALFDLIVDETDRTSFTDAKRNGILCRQSDNGRRFVSLLFPTLPINKSSEVTDLLSQEWASL